MGPEPRRAIVARPRPTAPAPGTEPRDDPAGRPDPRDPALDGIRGLAVAAVVAFHGGFGWAKGGYLGVSTFFTLSGFLITSLLLVPAASWVYFAIALLSGGVFLVMATRLHNGVKAGGDVKPLKKQEKHSIEVVIDRLTAKSTSRQRITDSVETALRLAEGILILDFVDLPEGDPHRQRRRFRWR